MRQFVVNGKELDLSTADLLRPSESGQSALEDQRVDEFIELVRRRFNTEAAVIASIRVNGTELNGEDEAALGALPVSVIDSIEVFTAHPRELAEETLQTLLEFTKQLEQLSRQAAAKLEAGIKPQEFLRLIDGLETFSAALLQIKQVLRIGVLGPVNVLEADLASVLKDLIDFTEAGNREYVIDLLQNHLPLNIQDWRLEGIPALIRARDS
jgi:hypothetical protein